MSKEQIMRRMRDISRNMEELARGGYRADVAANYLGPWAQELKQLAVAVEELPEPRMRDMVKNPRW